MQSSMAARRRWWGTFVLTLSIVMLIWGETLLQSFLHERPVLFLVFWLVCILLTGAAFLIAILEMRAIRRDWKGRQQALIRETMKDLKDQIDEGTNPDRTS